jgi:PhnB protein
MQVQPYLFFSGNCEEALEFYKKALGGGPTAPVASVKRAPRI